MTHQCLLFLLCHRMLEVAPIAVGTHLVVGDPPTQSLSQLVVPRTTVLGGGSQHSLHLIEKTVDAPQFASAFSLLCTQFERKHRWH